MNYHCKSGVGAIPAARRLHTSPFIDKYVAFLENQGRHPNNLPEFKTKEFFSIKKIRGAMRPEHAFSDAELLETTNTYIRLHNKSELTQDFIYPSPSAFVEHYHEIVNSKEFKKDSENTDVEHALSDPQIKEQIEFILEQITLSWGNKFPLETRIRLLARSFANFDKFCQTEEFQKLPESLQSQLSRFQTVRNFYRYVELNPQIVDIRKSPVMTASYLRSIIKQYNRL
jgi:hypothetical protein